MEKLENNQVKLVLTYKGGTQAQHFTIDLGKKVLTRHESFQDGKQTGTLTFDDFVEVAGSWWARKSKREDANGRLFQEMVLEIKPWSDDQFRSQFQGELADKQSIQFLRLPLINVATAVQRSADGSAGFDDRIVMVLKNAVTQQWDEMFRQVDAVEQLAKDKPGVRWLRPVLLATARRNDEARKRLLDEASGVAGKPNPNDRAVADFLIEQSRRVSEYPEQLEIVERLKPVYERKHRRLKRCFSGRSILWYALTICSVLKRHSHFVISLPLTIRGMCIGRKITRES